MKAKQTILETIGTIVSGHTGFKIPNKSHSKKKFPFPSCITT
jgi:hypothetical protein